MDAVFRTTDVVAIREWEAATRLVLHWHRAVGAARAAWFGTAAADYPPYANHSAFGGGVTLRGFGSPAGSTPPDGWRKERQWPRLLVPARSTKAGKPIARQFDALKTAPNPRKALEAFGMPAFTLSGLAACTYATAVVAGVLWIGWPCDMPPLPDTWERVPLSTYYALVEGGADPFARDDEKEGE